MPGFYGVISNDNEKVSKVSALKPVVNNDKLITGELNGDSFYIYRYVNKKFLEDKVFFENENYLIVTDGVLLNSSFLKKKYNQTFLYKTLIVMYERNGEDFFNEIRGSYSCLIYDKRKEKWLFYTDHIGDKKIYYMILDDGLLFGSRIIDIMRMAKKEGINLSLDSESCVFILTLGYMVDDRTTIKGIKRLIPGHYLRVEKGKIEVKKYHEFNNNPINQKSEDEIIEELDSLFREAVKLQFEKDKEYGYKHIASLSGGLDSRMVNYVAHELGYKDILNYTFSQSNYLDEKIAKDIAVTLGHEFIFKTLDDARFLLDIDQVIKINGGTSIYYGIAHSKNNIQLLNLDNYGMVHTGQLGDVVVGSFLKRPVYEKNFDLTSYVYSVMYIEKLKNLNIRQYPNDELFKMYNRGFNFALNGNLAFQEYTESMSPFCNVDVLQYCLNIPLHLRVNHQLYYKWIIRKYPKAADFIYESIKTKITSPKVYIKSKNFVIRAINKLLNTFRLPTLYGYNTKNGMNPFDYWYRTNNNLRNFIDQYYIDNIGLLDYLDQQNLKEMCENLFDKGITVEKIQVLTILGVTKLLFEVNDESDN